MLVKCQSCGNKIDRSTAFKVVINDVNKYYCTETEYQKIINMRSIRDTVYSDINDIFGYKVINTILFKEVNEIASIYTYSKISNYLIKNKTYLTTIMQKDFKNEYCKIKYFVAILKNSLSDFIDIEKVDIVKSIEVDISKDNYKPRIKRKSIAEFEQEVGDI